MISIEKITKLPTVYFNIKNASLFNRYFFGKEDPGNYFNLTSGRTIKTANHQDFIELEDILIYKRFGTLREVSLILDLAPGNGAFSLIMSAKAKKTLAITSGQQNPAFETNIANNQESVSNLELLPINRDQIPAEVSFLEHIFSVKALNECPLLHLQCFNYDQYDLVYKAPTKMIPLIKEFCISYKDLDKQRGYDMENLVRYIATAGGYQMNQLFVRGDGTGTIWLKKKES